MNNVKVMTVAKCKGEYFSKDDVVEVVVYDELKVVGRIESMGNKSIILDISEKYFKNTKEIMNEEISSIKKTGEYKRDDNIFNSKPVFVEIEEGKHG